ncbi:hypothetical protein [Pelosinus sp. IPA-1]|uniref:hypothetical protein n=1 Tax=Pelosinus sp. IPA-1 TaxID=3029569 RepID=UPI002436194F|nr:hypothetical protein [Pelosinus sp. IPA-1]GMB00451.1 hypothetical protein PIPA1_32500 [Pelosinus sp. IPA-1]
MDKQFHQLAPRIALKLMPEEFQAFFIADGYKESQISIDADLPDMVDHDNITINAEIHHAHSYKLEKLENGTYHWLDGDALERLKGLCADVHDFYAEGRFDMVRYCLAKMTHYRIDSMTYPHNHRGKPWSTYHTKFEDELGAFIIHNQNKIGELIFQPYADIYKGARQTALTAWEEGLVIVEQLEKGIPMTEEQKLHICRTCIKGIGDLWTTLWNEINRKKV